MMMIRRTNRIDSVQKRPESKVNYYYCYCYYYCGNGSDYIYSRETYYFLLRR